MEWDKLLFDPAENIYAKIVAQAKRQFSSEVIQETIFNDCLEQIQADDWEKLSDYKGVNGASPSSYFCTVFSRMMINEFRKRYGRCTVPNVFSKLGSEWQRLYRWVCCDNRHQQEVVDQFGEFLGGSEPVARAIQNIKATDHKCSTKGKMHTEADDYDFNAIAGDSIEQSLNQAEQEQLLLVLSQTFGFSAKEIEQSKLLPIKIDDEIVLLIKCIFQNGMKLPQAAEFVGLKVHTARRRLQVALEQIKQTLED